MHTAMQFAALVISIGLDTLCIGIALGESHVNHHLLTGLTFTSFTVMMPLAGLLLGHSLGTQLGAWGVLSGAILLIAMGAYMILRRYRNHDGFGHSLSGWLLITLAVTSTLDQLFVGFAMALIHAPMAATIALIASLALLLSFVGLRFHNALRPYFKGWTDSAGGMALALLGLWTLVVFL